MFCEYCGQPLRKEDRTCRKCGRPAGRFVQMEVFRDGKGMKISEDQVDTLPALNVPGEEIQALQPSQDDETTQLLRTRDAITGEDTDRTGMNREPGVVEEDTAEVLMAPSGPEDTQGPFRRGTEASAQPGAWENDDRLENLRSGMKRMKILTGVLAAAVVGLSAALIVPKILGGRKPDPVPETEPIAAAVTVTEMPGIGDGRDNTTQKVAMVETLTITQAPDGGTEAAMPGTEAALTVTPTPTVKPVVMPTVSPTPTPTGIPTPSAAVVTPVPERDTEVSVTPAEQREAEQKNNDQVQKQMLEGLRRNLKGT